MNRERPDMFLSFIVMISIGEIKDFHIERFIIIREYQSFIELINILICDRFEMIEYSLYRVMIPYRGILYNN